MTNDPLSFMHRHTAISRLQAHVNANYIARADYRKRRTAAKLGLERKRGQA